MNQELHLHFKGNLYIKTDERIDVTNGNTWVEYQNLQGQKFRRMKDDFESLVSSNHPENKIKCFPDSKYVPRFSKVTSTNVILFALGAA